MDTMPDLEHLDPDVDHIPVEVFNNLVDVVNLLVDFWLQMSDDDDGGAF